MHTGANTSDNGAHEMRVEDVQGIVDLAHQLGPSENVHRNPGDSA